MRGVIKMKKKIEMMIENYPINICLMIQFYDHEWGQCPLKYYGMTSGPRLYLHNQQNNFRLWQAANSPKKDSKHIKEYL